MAVKNLVSGVLAQSITTSTTNVLVNIAQGISASDIQSFFPTLPFYITIMPKNPAVGVANRLDSEILQVTAVGSDQSGNASLTCVRGQRDTTAKAFDAGSIVTVGVYAEDAVFLAKGSVSGGTTYRNKLVDKNGNTVIPIMGYMGTVYNATLSSATAGGRADYEFTPDTPVENNKVYAVMFPAPTVNNATIILGDGVVSGSILVPPVSATDSPNYELLTTDMINNTEPLLLMYSGVQWVCLNQKKKVATADLGNGAVTSSKIDFTTFIFQTNMPGVGRTTISSAWTPTNIGSSVTVSGLDPNATYLVLASTIFTEGTGEFRLKAAGANTVESNAYNATGLLVALSYQLQDVKPTSAGKIVFQRRFSGNTGSVRCDSYSITILRVN